MKTEAHTISWSGPTLTEVCICGVGARTPLGFSATASAAAVRGAISAVAIHPFFVDKADEPMALACDPGLDVDIGVTSRMEQMLISAIREALKDTLAAYRGAPVQCWIAMPESRPGLPAEAGRLVSSAVSNTFSGTPWTLHVLPRGHAAGLMAMQTAAEKVSIGETDFCVVAGVDSYHDLETLKWLDRHGRLMSSKNRNGFPPSEAAGACLVARRSTANRYGLPILATIMAAATSTEPHAIRSNGICIGEGLSAALKGVASSLRLPQQAITATYCDLNGERYRNDEFLYTLLRVQKAFVDAHDYECPADCWGDVGAASGLLFTCLAVASSQRGYAKGLYPILWASSESGHRTAVLLKLGSG
jgi:3-oxoacyl-[acyl-carrier-protein] synthase-1